MNNTISSFEQLESEPLTVSSFDELEVSDVPADPAVSDSPSTLDSIAGVAEPALTVASGIVAEPLAGISGIIAALNPLENQGAGGRTVEAVREFFTYDPKTEAGKEGLKSLSEAVSPVTDAFSGAEDYLGDTAYETTGSPAVAAFAKSIPTIGAELLGLAAGKGAVKATQKVKARAKQGKIDKSLADAVPSVEQLKDTSRAIYSEIDEMGGVVSEKAYNNLASQISRQAKKQGIDAEITPKAARAVQRINDMDGNVPLSELDTLRKVAQNVAKSESKADAALGTMMIDKIDSFMDNLPADQIKNVPGDIGKRYKVARDLWGRARRSEMLGEAFDKARNQASGFENGIRTQFRSILNNKNKKRYFKENEIKAMERVVQGDTKENIAKLIGRLGFSEGNATNVLGSALGATAGGVAFGTPGAVMVPLVGQLSRKLAQRMTRANAEFVDSVIRAGKDAEKITAAYIKHTPKAQRSAAELAELLMRPDIDLSKLTKSELAREAANLTQQNRAALAGVLANMPGEDNGQ